MVFIIHEKNWLQKYIFLIIFGLVLSSVTTILIINTYGQYENVNALVVEHFKAEHGIMPLPGTNRIQNSVNKLWETVAFLILFVLLTSILFNVLITKTLRLSVVKKTEALEKLNKGLELKVAERTREIKKEKDTIAKLLHKKTEFINQLSHDIRTPLTPILTMCSVLKMKLRAKDNRNRLDIIERNANYLSSLVVDTLNLAKLDLGKIKIDKKPVDIHSLIEDSLSMNSVMLKQKNIKVVDKSSEGIVVACDPLRIKEVIQNLISNAMKFMPGSGSIVFDAVRKRDKVLLSVKDDGIGMDKEQLKHIFEEFYKGDPSRHNLSAGLGLAICERIVKKHGGRIWAESEGPGKGSSFFIELPRK